MLRKEDHFCLLLQAPQCCKRNRKLNALVKNENYSKKYIADQISKKLSYQEKEAAQTGNPHPNISTT
jgi:hypothetical protein